VDAHAQAIELRIKKYREKEITWAIEKTDKKRIAVFWRLFCGGLPEVLEGKIEVAAKDMIKIDANENPYGCSPRVNKAWLINPQFHIYPDDGQERLRKLLAGYVVSMPNTSWPEMAVTN